MLFKRRGLSKFVSGPYTIVRPSGALGGRGSFDIRADGRDLNVRMDDGHVWLMDGDDEVAYAVGSAASWELKLGELELTMAQPKFAVNHSVFSAGSDVFAQTRASGFPLRTAELLGAEDLDPAQRAFLVAVSLLAWRESDREFSSAGRVPTVD